MYGKCLVRTDVNIIHLVENCIIEWQLISEYKEFYDNFTTTRLSYLFSEYFVEYAYANTITRIVSAFAYKLSTKT